VKAVTSALTLHEVLAGARKTGDDRLFSLCRDLIGTFPNLHLVPFDARIAEINCAVYFSSGMLLTGKL